ncbi:hypothetical protein BRC2024_KCUCJSVR_CDS_0056 [Acinetobacter phage vB_AbaM_KissB]|uniref:hypothetical protein n=1 Tax=Acinetobacter phage vB_AbaM_phiAbaA1 TaxID=1605379 RepID=UPI00078E72BD|nr:hypothetical protein BJD49_gp062 [Acinetobacter phage vB_AbaM_phiAbaA1]AJK27228.1 hypothetical protein phiAbaA1_125 [Acinetobacter phage vB_AbaM_phiAbaA1]
MKAKIIASQESLIGMCLGGVTVQGKPLEAGLIIEVELADHDVSGNVYSFIGELGDDEGVLWFIYGDLLEIIEE